MTFKEINMADPDATVRFVNNEKLLRDATYYIFDLLNVRRPGIDLMSFPRQKQREFVEGILQTCGAKSIGEFTSGKYDEIIINYMKFVNIQYGAVKNEFTSNENNKEVQLKTKKKSSENKFILGLMGLTMSAVIFVEGIYPHIVQKEVDEKLGNIASEEENEKRTIVDQNYIMFQNSEGKTVREFNVEEIAKDIISVVKKDNSLFDVSIASVYSDIKEYENVENALYFMDSILEKVNELSSNDMELVVVNKKSDITFLEYLLKNCEDRVLISNTKMVMEEIINKYKNGTSYNELTEDEKNIIDRFTKKYNNHKKNVYEEAHEMLKDMDFELEGEGFGR